MSFEGYYQTLCSKGHLSCFDIWGFGYENSISEIKCRCGEGMVFSHLVDETNGEGERYPFEINTPAKIEICNLGHTHVITEVTYKIPKRR